ncbi:hypothetical protein HDV05_002686 [Chytridiales sp. JEL 0842]|nr:hypothetical protein HDV05_002686 [Chytridiales sp. JEL 0842]
MEPWRPFIFIPLNIAILFILKASRKQWLQMSTTSLASFLVFTTIRASFSQDLASSVAAFVLGVFANGWARYKNEIAIASVMAGINWIVPGVVGARSAFAFFDDTDEEQGVSGTLFGMDMVIRAMSIAIGLHLANVALFPMKNKKGKALDDAMAV